MSKGGVVKGISKGGFRRLAVVVAVAAAGILVVGAQAASAGTLEVCKSGQNGFSNKTFRFTVTPNVGAAVVVDIKPTSNAFTCKSPSLPSATSATIVESDVDASSETQSIAVIPSSREVGGTKDLTLRRVSVLLGTTTSNETQVRFVNQPPGGTSGTLKVCKLTATPAYLGRSFSFSVGPTLANQGPLVSTTANDVNDDPANWSCRVLGTFQVGTNLFVKEQIPAGTEVDFIDSDPGANLLDFNTDEGWAQVHIGTGTTIVLFDDEPIPPSGTGFIEVCKNPPGFTDPAVTGLWHFTITDSAGTVYERDVVTGQCTEHIQIAAGIATVQETARTGFQLTDIFTQPADALVNSNLINRTADVEIPTSSSPLDEVMVAFVNKPITSLFKVCKALGPNSSVLVGQTFHFHVTDITDPDNEVFLGDVAVTAGTSTGCTPFRILPIGTVVRVDEFFGPDNPMTPFDESGQFITTTSPQTTTIGAGTANSVTITNTAFGLIQICKNRVGGNQPTFRFQIDTGAIFNVPANGCASARQVSVGNHTVTEIAPGDYEVTAIDVNPTGRLVGTPDLANRKVTVSVPYGIEGETAVTYTNQVKQGRVKICKTIPLGSFDALNGDQFNYLIYIQTGGTHAAPTFNGGGPAGPPIMVSLNASTDRNNLTTCTGFTGFFPILQANGEKTIVGVQEQLTGGFVVDSITASPNNGLCTFGTGLPAGGNTSPVCVPTGVDKTGAVTPGYATIDFFLSGGNLGNVAVTFTNRAT
jgi:hypothetical protein